jgi:predicted ATPase
MIEEINIRNVRLFDGPDEWRIPIAPLSVFCGTNSAGKSTILKSLLLLCQSNAETDVGKREGRLRFAGTLVDLGSYQSFVSHNRIDQDIEIGVTIRNSIESRYLRRLQKGRDEASRELSGSFSQIRQEYVLSSRFYCGVRKAEQQSDEEIIGVATAQETSHAGQAFLKEASFHFHTETNIDLVWKIVLNESSNDYAALIPLDYFGKSGGFTMMDVPKDVIEGYVKIDAFIRGLLPIGVWAQAKSRKTKDADKPKDWSFFPLPPLIRDCSNQLRLELERIHYLGPLRSAAKRYYMTNLDVLPAMDAAGEFLPYVLRDQRNENVTYVPPGRGAGVAEKPLKYALDSWMYYLRTGRYLEDEQGEDLHEIDVTSMKEVLLEFTLKSFGGEAHALADSGFGYSQLLPIVVRGLIAEVTSTIIIEQPELHLNPALQVRLSEFLASLTLAGKCVLIETHSEHIVNAIRVLTAEDPTKSLAKKCRIFFLDTESGMPRIKQLEIQSDGTVPEWPRQFFGDALSLSARLLRAQDKLEKDPKID